MFFNFKNYECKDTTFSGEKERFFYRFFLYQQSEVSSQQSEARSQKSEVRSQNFFVSLQPKQNNNTINNASQ